MGQPTNNVIEIISDIQQVKNADLVLPNYLGLVQKFYYAFINAHVKRLPRIVAFGQTALFV